MIFKHPFWVSRAVILYLWTMFIRRKRNKSGTYSVQVISKFDGRYKLEMSFGSSSDEKILKDLEYRASEWIAQYRGQTVIDFPIRGAMRTFGSRPRVFLTLLTRSFLTDRT